MSSIVEEAIKTIPDLETILKESVKILKLDKMPADQILENFEKMIRDIETTAFSLYKEHEMKAFHRLKDLWFSQKKDWIKNIIEQKGVEGIKEVLSAFITTIREFEFRAGQMGKARGGKTLEQSQKFC